MTDVTERFAEVDDVATPDVWKEVESRSRRIAEGASPRFVAPRRQRGRLVAGVVAFTVFAAAAAFAWIALRPGGSTEPLGTREHPLRPCSLLTPAEIEATLHSEFSLGRQLTAADFKTPVSPSVVACKYGSGRPYGSLILGVSSMSRDTFEREFVNRDPRNSQPVAGVGEIASFFACGGLDVYSQGRAIQVGVQYARCGSLETRLRQLAWIVLGRLGLPMSGTDPSNSNYVFTNVTIRQYRPRGNEATLHYFDHWSSNRYPGLHECTWSALDSAGHVVGSFTDGLVGLGPKGYAEQTVHVTARPTAGAVWCGPERSDVPVALDVTNVHLAPHGSSEFVVEYDASMPASVPHAVAGANVCHLKIVDQSDTTLVSRRYTFAAGIRPPFKHLQEILSLKLLPPHDRDLQGLSAGVSCVALEGSGDLSVAGPAPSISPSPGA